MNRTDDIVSRGYTTDMKPCPFCEAEKLEVRRVLASVYMHMVRCMKCGAEGPNIKESGSIGSSAAEAIDCWNART